MQRDIADSKPFPPGQNVLMLGTIVIYNYKFRITAGIQMESVFVIAAAATTVHEPRFAGFGNQSRIAFVGIGVGQLRIGHHSILIDTIEQR